MSVVMVSFLFLSLLSHFSRVQLCETPETAAHQAPRSLGFSGQEHWSGLPFPSPMHESEKWKWSCLVVSDPQRPHGLQPSRLLCPWDFPGKSAGVGCHCLLRGKDLDAGKHGRQEEKGTTEDEMVGIASLTQWTWVWASTRRWWRTGKPGVLQSIGSQIVRPTKRLNNHPSLPCLQLEDSFLTEQKEMEQRFHWGRKKLEFWMVKQLEFVEQNSRKRRMNRWRDFEVCVEINLRALAWVRLHICRFWKHNGDNIRESTVLGESSVQPEWRDLRYSAETLESHTWGIRTMTWSKRQNWNRPTLTKKIKPDNIRRLAINLNACQNETQHT